MKTSTFLDLIKKGENERVEFKSKVSKDIGEEICALSNAQGGYIFIGITDEGDFSGCIIKTAKDEISNYLTNITPPLRIQYHTITIDQKDILILEIPTSKHLCAIGGTVYIRTGTSKRPLYIQEILTMGSEYLLFEIDKTPTEEKIIDKKLLQYFIKQSRIEINDPLAYLKRIGVVTKNNYLTIVGVLLFTKDPQSLLPHTAVRFIRDDSTWKRFSGPIWKIIGDLEQEFQGLFGRVPIQPGFKRVDIIEYPMKAVREAIINAIVHRNYAIKSEIFIQLTVESLTIKNPGSFPPGTTPKEPHPIPRNPLLYELLFQMGFVERQGRGVALIYEECKKHPFVTVNYNLSATFTEIVFTKEKNLLSSMDKNILSILSNGEKTSSEIAEHLHVSKITVLRRIDRLQKIGFVKKLGSGPSTRYQPGLPLHHATTTTIPR